MLRGYALVFKGFLDVLQIFDDRQMLGTDLLTLAAGDAGAGLAVAHGGAVVVHGGEVQSTVLLEVVVGRKIGGNINVLGAALHTVAAGSAGHGDGAMDDLCGLFPVSYTHLTLPTILLV